MIFYSSGLRISEALNLKVSDIDSERMLIHIKGTKSKKDRMEILSSVALESLRKYYKNTDRSFGYLKVYPGKNIQAVAARPS